MAIIKFTVIMYALFQVSHQVGSLMDLYTTLVKLAGQEPPKDRTVDGIDLSPVLFGQKAIDRYKHSYVHSSG